MEDSTESGTVIDAGIFVVIFMVGTFVDISVLLYETTISG